MAMSLELAGALLFVLKRLGLNPDGSLNNTPLPPNVDLLGLATALEQRVANSQLVAGTVLVTLNAVSLGAAYSGWKTQHDVATSMINCSVKAHEPEDQGRPAKFAFADFLIVRWIILEIGHHEVAARPNFDENLPPLMTKENKLGLAAVLAQRVQTAGMQIDKAALVEAAPNWQRVSQVRTSVYENTEK